MHHLLHKTGVQQIYGVIYDNKQSGVLSPQNILPGGVSSPVDIERGRHPGWVSVVRCLIVFMVHSSARERWRGEMWNLTCGNFFPKWLYFNVENFSICCSGNLKRMCLLLDGAPPLLTLFLLVCVFCTFLFSSSSAASSLQVDLPFATPVVLTPNENEDQPLETRGFWLGIFAAQGGSVIRLYGNTCKADNRNVR